MFLLLVSLLLIPIIILIIKGASSAGCAYRHAIVHALLPLVHQGRGRHLVLGISTGPRSRFLIALLMVSLRLGQQYYPCIVIVACKNTFALLHQLGLICFHPQTIGIMAASQVSPQQVSRLHFIACLALSAHTSRPLSPFARLSITP